MTLRPYDAADLGELLDVWERSARVAHSFLPEEFFEAERDEIATRWLPITETVVAVDRDRVVGFVSLLDDEVGAIFVAPEHQGGGVGRALMDHARSTRAVLELDVFEANTQGRAFYEAYGFDIVGRSIHEATGAPQLRLRLS